jgi:hypothetical protein
MINKANARKKAKAPKDIGVCPYCGKVDGYYNYGPNHYFVCFEHKARWLGAYDLFSTWRNETTGDWISNRQTFEDYELVVPAPNRKAMHNSVYNYLRFESNTEWV